MVILPWVVCQQSTPLCLIRKQFNRKLSEIKDNEDRKQDVDLICRHVYDLAMLSHRPMEPEEMVGFVKRSNQLLSRLAELEANCKNI